MQSGGTRRAMVAMAALGSLLTMTTLSACGSAHPRHTGGEGRSGPQAAHPRPAAVSPAPTRVPDVGDRLHRDIPAGTRQVLAVYGDGKDSPDSTAVLFTKHGSTWDRTRSWPAHNGKRGWTLDHHLGDERSPVGVFTLTAAGGVLDDPGTALPYSQDESYEAPRDWDESHWHDFDYVIAIDYNRVKGTPPDDAEQPEGEDKGGGIWLHLDHGSGTSACVSLPKEAMEYLLRTLDPEQHPVVLMGDRGDLKG
ncbi:L,D-transpeptidase family protein [Streptomyces sp. W16]|uniref:L,D-transpeptidase family protein n=1 Tax=Streptomyces sp. W16 TaxID=3076631 RepID=UPI00295B7747|nr:L,D-transpeptidase family protein [Streptomyces sp. W16]MDV9169927.1 L,D-transpeptidase family protein [Streptomyces sp. W16]